MDNQFRSEEKELQVRGRDDGPRARGNGKKTDQCFWRCFNNAGQMHACPVRMEIGEGKMEFPSQNDFKCFCLLRHLRKHQVSYSHDRDFSRLQPTRRNKKTWFVKACLSMGVSII
ncbi:hypothetical protein TWF694_003398 [Orbilia ellipsospora]|uniref:Uncharacterized protein n=1 Tax=Orbilia ellipsospora TaxID=2528407 RepID=A0AAV9X0J1_9PEZI